MTEQLTDIEKQTLAKSMIASVASSFGGTLGDWVKAPAISLWDYTNFMLNDETIRVGASGGGIVSVDRRSHDPAGKVNDNLGSIFASVVAAFPRQRLINPVSPEGYALIVDNPGLQRLYQHELNALFQSRVRIVRDELKGLGWVAGRGLTLEKDEDKIYYEPKLAQPDLTLIGVTWKINDGDDGVFVDDLNKDPASLAATMSAACKAELCHEGDESWLSQGC